MRAVTSFVVVQPHVMPGFTDRHEPDSGVAAVRGWVSQVGIEACRSFPFREMRSATAAVTDPAYPRPRSDGGVYWIAHEPGPGSVHSRSSALDGFSTRPRIRLYLTSFASKAGWWYLMNSASCIIDYHYSGRKRHPLTTVWSIRVMSPMPWSTILARSTSAMRREWPSLVPGRLRQRRPRV